MKKLYYSLVLGTLCLSGVSKAQTTQTFTYTGSAQTFTVPTCVSEVTITVHGAQGSNGNASTSPAGIGGNGAIVTGTYAVSSGDVLNIFVGGAGTLTTGGFNGGGVNAANSSAGGGGASDVRYNGSALTDRIIVAGGGGAGGNGGCFGTAVGGGNGGPGGGNGIAGANSSAGGGGFPGVGTFFGSFGVGCGPFQGQSGSNGSGGVGGAGGLGTSLCSTSPTSGGSGGGGFIGGGGGGAGAAGTVGCSFNDTGAGGGGAGGDCYVDAAMTNTTINPGGAAVGNGLVTITYTVNSPAIIQSLGDQRCGNGVIDLSATASGGSIDWYDALTGGTLLATGSTYSPTISSTTPFFAEHNLGGGCVSSPRTTVLATVNNDVTGPTTTTSSCGDYDWNGTTYSTSGLYDQVFTTVNGCDSTVTLNLTVDNVDLGVTQTGFNVLTSDQNGASYQWIDCVTNQPINGETNQTFTASQDGSYAVMVGLGACDEMSDCTDLIFANLDENMTNLVSVYPNPTNGVFTVNISDVKATSIAVYNAVGEEVYQAKCNGNNAVIDLKNNAKGVYFIKVVTNDGILNQRVVKQ
jgi:hypothetical protein